MIRSMDMGFILGSMESVTQVGGCWASKMAMALIHHHQWKEKEKVDKLSMAYGKKAGK